MKGIVFVALLLFSASASVAAGIAKPKAMDLSTLYKSFTDKGSSTSDMPEYEQEILVSGVVLNQSESLTGDALMSAGSAQSDDELARITPADEKEGAKMKALAVGSAFQAVCVVGFASGSAYIPLTDCVFK
ncbi:hypothetical protein [Dyella silvatica]|uniref:hypothetical protein n=1 Tax=Dyella silvatica TaxID=2992128 RepID=UPI00224E461F|nr:hypothetical protein [Dyella silvatica]